MADNEIVRTRAEMEQELIDQDIEDIMENHVKYSDVSQLTDILLNGFKGYANFTNDQIQNEYMNRIVPDDAILVIKDEA